MADRLRVPSARLSDDSDKTYPTEADAHNAACDAAEEIKAVAERYGLRIAGCVFANHEKGRAGVLIRLGDRADVIDHLGQFAAAHPVEFIIATAALGKDGDQ